MEYHCSNHQEMLTFWVVLSSCFAVWSWLRNSDTLRLAADNWPCKAFISGLSGFKRERECHWAHAETPNKITHTPEI